MKKYPDLLYVSREEDHGNIMFIADPHQEGFALIGESVKVAVYSLVKIISLKAEISAE